MSPIFEHCSQECLNQVLEILNAMSHPLRFKIIKMLSGGSMYNSELKKAFPEYDPSNITKHLNILRQNNIIEAVKEGRETYYRLHFTGMPVIISELRNFISEEFHK